MAEEAPALLRDLVILLGAAIPVVFIVQKLRVQSLVGFLLAGMLIGPSGLGAIASPEQVERLAEIGIVLLLFVVGLELSVSGLLKLGGPLLRVGALQIGVTGALGAGIAWLAGLSWPGAILIGFLVVHSSTVVALKVLADRRQVDAPHGRVAAGVLVLQDLAIVPMMLLVPALGASDGFHPSSILWSLGSAVVVVAAIVLGARVLLPALLRQVANLGLRDLFTVTIVAFCLGTAWLSQQLGLSLAIGALIAGLVISDSEYSHQVFAEIAPFRDVFTSLFFLSIGMLLRTDLLVDRFAEVAGATVGIMLLKGVILTAVTLPVVGSLRLAVVVGACLSQVGELAIVLERFARPYDLIGPEQAELFLGVTVISFIVSPLLVEPAEKLGYWWQTRRATRAEETADEVDPISRHVVVIGYGLNGQNLVRVLRETGIPFRVVSLDTRWAGARRAGEPIVYGDATRPDVLRVVAAERAAIIVIAISDPTGTRHIVDLARRQNQSAAILVRTRYVAEIDELYRLGATEVIAEEFETSVEIFARVLHRLRMPRNVIDLQIELIRGESYEMLRGVELPQRSLSDVQDLLAAALTETFRLAAGSPAIGQTLRELRLRSETGVTIIAVVSEGKPRANPDPDLRLKEGDVLVLLGNHAELEQAIARLSPPES